MEAPNPRARHLYLVQTTFGGEDVEGWQNWYDAKHVPELLSVPGFVAADRYRHISKPEQFIAVYEISGPSVFAEERYKHVTGWGEWAHAIKEWRRGIYQRLDDPKSWSPMP